MASPQELEFLIETHQRASAVLEAKAARDALGHVGGRRGLAEGRNLDGTEALAEAEAAARDAKDAYSAHREFWRGIRAFIEAENAPGDAVATPEAHGMGTSIQGQEG